MHAEDREKVMALITAILLAPRFDPALVSQTDAGELAHDPLIAGSIRAARAICDAIEDQESRHDAVVFEPAQREPDVEQVKRAARKLAEIGRKQE